MLGQIGNPPTTDVRLPSALGPSGEKIRFAGVCSVDLQVETLVLQLADLAVTENDVPMLLIGMDLLGGQGKVSAANIMLGAKFLSF
jgi:sensor domain CHASE-containing protein